MPQITLKAARTNAGLNQSEAAEKLGVAISTLRNWEQGKTFPKQPQIEELCKLYTIPFDALFFGLKIS